MLWNEDQRALRAAIENLGDVLSKDHVERDGRGEFGDDAWKRVRETGLLGLPFDPEWGGLGQDLLTTMYVLEGLGYGCRDGGLNFSTSTHVVSAGVPLQRFGSNYLKDRYLRRICDGTAIGAHAITEPEGGSDVMAMRTSATPDGDDYVLDGSKAFVSNGPIADVFVVYARTGKRGSPAAITAFLVDRDTPGLSVGKPIAKMGLRTSPLCELFLDGCRVPKANVLGSVGAGFLILDHVMKWEILCSFVINAGEMRHRLERCVEYANSRKQFGKPIGQYQSVANKIVEMKIAVENSRKWLYDTAERLQNGENVTVDIAISKLITSEGNVSSALAAVQVFGGYGYTAEYGLEKDLRNAVAGTIYSGTSDIQRQRIASMIGL
ncbi:acyl-CoA dehydrogenase family protein [Umezawaea sp. Da 62-37]|uniref:acyl-CoA dehydrogenase family protein n=1 Tax=Umezawaea sp. Da 62-37 TaxID=3075927 RepID=UPI0028F6EA62|nr:acyl-CoA dehydrogenase family protein [Umezawaea sp. Da 62-37]WNV86424.1 acyl-CoA dehydrogenase family protein [Umezawaea sp. Da 62-37]